MHFTCNNSVFQVLNVIKAAFFQNKQTRSTEISLAYKIVTANMLANNFWLIYSADSNISYFSYFSFW